MTASPKSSIPFIPTEKTFANLQNYPIGLSCVRDSLYSSLQTYTRLISF